MSDQSEQPPAKNRDIESYYGHRSRVRQRFINNGFAGMLKYEVLEAMLMLALPRKDVKPLAKNLLAKYKTVLGVISLSQGELEKFPEINFSVMPEMRDQESSGPRCCRESGMRKRR